MVGLPNALALLTRGVHAAAGHDAVSLLLLLLSYARVCVCVSRRVEKNNVNTCFSSFFSSLTAEWKGKKKKKEEGKSTNDSS